MYRRIYIFGGPGVGKTTYSQRLSRDFGHYVISLDSIAYDNTGKKGSESDMKRKLHELLVKEEMWIAEGGYLGWCDELFTQADVVVILQVSRLRSLLRIITRYTTQYDSKYGLLSTCRLCTQVLPSYYKEDVLEYPRLAGSKKVISLVNCSYCELVNILNDLQ